MSSEVINELTIAIFLGFMACGSVVILACNGQKL